MTPPQAAAGPGRHRPLKEMFGEITPRYDILNRFMSLGRDLFWRRSLSERLLVLDPPGKFLDLATGSGDQLVAAGARWPGAELTGLDFSKPMLELARRKVTSARAAARVEAREAGGPAVPPSPEPVLIHGDALHNDLPENAFDSVSISFGLRNISPRRELYKTVLRVLKPGGRFLVLELFFEPRSLWAPVHRFYLKSAIPGLVGGLFEGAGDAYGYLGESVVAFPHPDVLIDQMARAGFVGLGRRTHTFGVAMLVWGHKPAA
ncbi:MAG: ubiquinone/menaquinone biosynthesis methyltransferase [Deltaproteobacteria bacterium]|jgi:demethylmenaquinone methyltransferase/2-methoxy-6-polyprenyl-1,4-benzoquinol methylase|nr:ubiquinone/menaquinone biosynthesis methyltransferase [Deltaproteobacteria bacterium]